MANEIKEDSFIDAFLNGKKKVFSPAPPKVVYHRLRSLSNDFAQKTT